MGEYAESDVSSESEYDPEPEKGNAKQTDVELSHEEDIEVANIDEFGVNAVLQQILVGEDDAQDLKMQAQGAKLLVWGYWKHKSIVVVFTTRKISRLDDLIQTHKRPIN